MVLKILLWECSVYVVYLPTPYTCSPSAYINLHILYYERRLWITRDYGDDVSFVFFPPPCRLGHCWRFMALKAIRYTGTFSVEKINVCKKKKINLDFLWIHKHSDTTHNPRGAGSHWEREKNLSFVRKTLRFICVRLTHNCRQVIIIFFWP